MDPDCQITKIDQGCIEKYFGSIKHVRGHQAIVPARHVLDSYKTVLANSIIFTEKAKQAKKTKQNKSEGKFYFHNIQISILKFFHSIQHPKNLQLKPRVFGALRVFLNRKQFKIIFILFYYLRL
jgi:hypothetical protein